VIQGTVVGLQVLVGVVFRLSNQPNLRIEFVLDTGFEGALTLPPDAVAALGLFPLGQTDAHLADDSYTQIAVHEATIVWDGREVDVAVLAMGNRPLLGTALLDGFNLNADFADNGPVALRHL
jgi:clan AA aspartic protease